MKLKLWWKIKNGTASKKKSFTNGQVVAKTKRKVRTCEGGEHRKGGASRRANGNSGVSTGNGGTNWLLAEKVK